MNQQQYLEHMIGKDQQGFQELIGKIYPQMEVRAFIKEGVQEMELDPIKNGEHALTRLKLILYAWKYDIDNKVSMTYSRTAHSSDSIMQTLRTCFFSQGWLMELYFLLQKQGKITEEIHTLARDAALDILQLGERGANNRSFFYGLGHAYAIQNFPEVSKCDMWRKYAEAVFYDWYEGGDCVEPGYIAVNISIVVKLGILLGKEEELKSERAQKIFKRYLDHVSPSGLIIAPGDGDDQSSYLDAFKIIYQITGNEEYLWAWEKVSAAGEYGGYRGKCKERKLPENQVICEYREPEENCTQIQLLCPGTANLKDRLILNPSRKTGNPYMAMMIQDRYESYHHMSEDNRGEIYHYEADGVLCLKRSSWYKWAEQTNTVVLKDAVEEFPFVYSEGLHKEHWYHASADLRIMDHFLPDENLEPFLKPIENFKHYEKARDIVHEYDMPLVTQYIDKKSPYGVFLLNTRGIEGKNSQWNLDSITLSIHNFTEEYWNGRSNDHPSCFEASMSWGRDDQCSLAYDNQESDLEICNLHLAGPCGKLYLHTEYDLCSMLQAVWYPLEGGHKLLTEEEFSKLIQVRECAGAPVFRIHCPFGRLDLFFKGFDRHIDSTEEYTRIGFDYCYLSDVSNYLRTPIKILVNGYVSRSLHVDHQQGGVLKECLTEQKGNDCYGEVYYEGVYTYDTAWKRKTLLLEEGYLVVVDEIDPGEDAKGMAGGPIWQLPKPPVMGLHWADAVVESQLKKNLMVYFHPQRGHRFGVQCQPKLWVDREYAFYDRAVLQPGKKEVFVSVLIPHDSAINPIELCKKKNEGGRLEPSIKRSLSGVNTEDERTTGVVTHVEKNHDVTVTFNHPPLCMMKISMKNNGKWSVERG